MGYVPFIVLGTVARMLTRVLLVWGPPGNVACQQVGQIGYALGSFAEPVFFAYVYTLIQRPSREQYQIVTSSVQATFLVAHVFSSLLGDLLLVAVP